MVSSLEAIGTAHVIEMNRGLHLVMAAIFFLFAAQTMVFVLIPLAAASMAIRGTLIGFLVAIPAGLTVLADPPTSAASDALGRRPLLIAGGGLGALAAVIFAFASSFLMLVVAATLWGLSVSLCERPVQAWLTEMCPPEDHVRMQGYNGAVQGVAAIAGALLAGLTLGVTHTPGFVLVAFLALFVTVTATLAVEPSNASRGRFSTGLLIGGYRRAAAMMRDSPRLQAAALIALTNGSMILVIGNSFIPLYVVHALGYSSVTAGVLLGVRSLSATVTSTSFGAVASRLSVRRLILLTNGFGLLAVALTPLSASIEVLLVLLSVQGFGFGSNSAASNVLVASATLPIPGPRFALGR